MKTGLQAADYPFEMEIYGLHDGYDGIDGGATLRLHTYDINKFVHSIKVAF